MTLISTTRRSIRAATVQGFRLLGAAAVGAATALALAAPAGAHAGVVGSDPENGATLPEAPESASITFSEIVDGPSTEVAVTGPDGATLDLEAPVFDGETITQPMDYTEPGEYILAYRMVSEDGHRIDGTLTFTVETVPTGPETTDASVSESEPASAIPEASEAPPTAVADDADGGTDTGVLLASLLLLALLAVGGGAAAIQIRRRRARHQCT